MLWIEAVLLLRPRSTGCRSTTRTRCAGPSAARSRNVDWFHMLNADIISMPDKWEYPWYAAWDLAFHTLALSLVDLEFAKEQLELMLREGYLHPNGQIPAYEWNFGDVNPPVHAWATLFVYSVDRGKNGRWRSAISCERSFQKLLLQLHLVGQPQGPHGTQRLRGRLPRPRQHRRLRPQRAAADRRAPRAGRRHGVDGLLLPEHARDRPRARQRRSGVRGHRIQVRRAFPVDRERDGPHRAITRTRCGTRPTASFTTCCRLPDGSAGRLKVRSMVGLLPLCAATVFPADVAQRFPKLMARMEEFLKRNPDLRRLLVRAGHRTDRAPAARAARREEAAPRAVTHAGRARIPRAWRHPFAVAPSPRPPLRAAPRRARVRGALPARRVRQRHVRRQFELARSGVDAGERADHSRAAAVLPVLRGLVPDRVSPPAPAAN